jgi:hypothetical protein
MAGRSRTGARPSSTVMWDASYVSFKENLRQRMMTSFKKSRAKTCAIHNKYWFYEDLRLMHRRKIPGKIRDISGFF